MNIQIITKKKGPCYTVMDDTSQVYKMSLWSKCSTGSRGKSCTTVMWKFVYNDSRYELKLEHSRKDDAKPNCVIFVNGEISTVKKNNRGKIKYHKKIVWPTLF